MFVIFFTELHEILGSRPEFGTANDLMSQPAWNMSKVKVSGFSILQHRRHRHGDKGYKYL